MKDTIYLTTGALMGFGLIYLLTAFIAWDMYPGNWSESARATAAILGSMAALGGMMLAALAVVKEQGEQQ